MPDCPTCGESYKSEHGVKVHHKRIHGESIAGEPVNCDWCEDTFYRKPYSIDRYEHHFCCRECKDNFHSDYMEGRERPEHAKKISEMFQGENNPAWKDGSLAGDWRSTAEWQNTRQTTLERDGHECQVCETEEDLHVHHIEPVYQGGAKFDTGNLITLCEEHHYQRH